MDIPLHNWLVLGSESAKKNCLVLFGIKRLTKIFYELSDHQEVLNMDISWQNWLVADLSALIFFFKSLLRSLNPK
jgi:uncharacterized protein Usg